MMCLHNTMLFFMHARVGRSTEDMSDYDNGFDSRQNMEKYLQDIEHFIETCPFLTTIPFNGRRNEVWACNAMDLIVLVEAISDYRKETQVASRKYSDNQPLRKDRAKSEGHISVQVQNTEIEGPPKCRRNSIAKNPMRKFRRKFSSPSQ